MSSACPAPAPVGLHRACQVQLHPQHSPEAVVRALVPDAALVRHRFTPHGLSVAGVGALGSAAVHTWPERGLATVDAYGAAALSLLPCLRALGWTILES